MSFRHPRRLLDLVALVLFLVAVVPGTQAAWVNPTNLGAVVNSASDEYGATITVDGVTLLMDSNRGGGLGAQDLYQSTWNGSFWGPPLSLGSGVNTAGIEYAPSVSSDGSTLFFMAGNWDIYSATKTAGVWSNRQKVTVVSTPTFEEWAPGVSYDENTLVLTALNRTGGQGGHDLWFSEKLLGAWTAPTNPGPPLNTSAHEYAGSLSTSGDTLYFSRDGDLFQAWRSGEAWNEPVSLGPLVNSEFYDTHPVVSSNGLILYFSSERPGGQGGYDLWKATWQESTGLEDPGLSIGGGIRFVGPNPFQAGLPFTLDLERSQVLRLEIFSLTGQRIRSLRSGLIASGRHEVGWDGRSESGDAVPSGVYWIRVRGEAGSADRKLVVLR